MATAVCMVARGVEIIVNMASRALNEAKSALENLWATSNWHKKLNTFSTVVPVKTKIIFLEKVSKLLALLIIKRMPTK